VPINVNNPEADTLTRKFAEIAGVGITEAIVIAMKEAIARRGRAESPLDTAARIREKYGVRLSDQARRPLPARAFDDMWGDAPERDSQERDSQERDSQDRDG
jgi:antitoxin VapB